MSSAFEEPRETFAGSNVGMSPPRSAVSPSAAATTIWLDALVRSLDLPAEERHQVRLELQSHIEDRVRDLMVEGVQEADATRRALAECGEASSLAGGFREVRKALRRRTLMNIGVVGAACGLVVFGLGSLRGTNCPPEELAAQAGQAAAIQGSAARSQALTAQIQGASAALSETVASSSLIAGLGQASGGAGVTEIKNTGLEDVLSFIGKQSGHPFAVNWASLGVAGLERGTPVDATIPGGDPEEIIAILNDVLGGDPDSGPGPLAIRERGGVFEIASAAWVDKHDVQIETYDITPAMESGASAEDLRNAITQFIEPNNWKENGGERAQMSVVGNRLLVKAPSRLHERVKWMLEQFSHSAETNAGPGIALPAVAPMDIGVGEPARAPEPGAGEPPAIAEPGAGEPAHSTMKSVVIQHTEANLVAALVKALAERSEHETKVVVNTDSAQNRIVLRGMSDDVARCELFARVVDGAIAAPPQTGLDGVPMLKDLPLLSAMFAKQSARVNLSTWAEPRAEPQLPAPGTEAK